MMKKKTYRFSSGGEDDPLTPEPSEEEVTMLHYLDEAKPPAKDRADYLEVVNNRIYFYSGVETKNVLLMPY